MTEYDWDDLPSASESQQEVPPDKNALVRLFKSATRIIVTPQDIYIDYGLQYRGEYDHRRYSDRVPRGLSLEQIAALEEQTRRKGARNGRPILVELEEAR